jgi:hypothetical protein
MEIKRVDSQVPLKDQLIGYGTVRIDPLFEAVEPARVRGANVTFEPGAHRMAYASTRQTLIVTSGLVAAKAGRSRKSGRAMSSGFHLTRNIGTAPHLRPR